MKDDELISELLEAQARDDAADPLRDPLWEKLAAGTLSADERKELDARAATDESLREAIALLAPLGESFEARVTAKIDAARAEASKRAHANADRPENKVDHAEANVEANVLPFRRRIVGVVGALAVAAGVAFLALNPSWSSRGGNSEGSLPAYAMIVTGGQKDVRSNDAPSNGGVVRVGPDSELALVFRPAESVAPAGIELHALLVRDGAAQAWSPPYKVSPSGVVQIVGAASSLGLGAPGELDAIIAVGRPAPTDPQLLLRPPPNAAYQVFRAHLLVSAR